MAQLARAEVANLIQSVGVVGEDNIDTMVAIAKCESDYRTTIVHTNRDGTTDTGLWQINSIHRKKHPDWTVAWLKDRTHNAQAARTLYEASGFSPWDSSRSCWEKEVKTSRSERDTSLYDVPVVGDTAEAIANVGATFATVGGVIIDAAKWLGDPGNWLRILFVVGGIGLGVVAGASVLSESKTGKQLVSAGKAAATKGMAS